MLNIVWISFFFAAFITGLVKWLALGDTNVFAAMMDAMFTTSKSAFEISLGLTGILALWLGIMKIGERSGFIQLLASLLTPLFKRLMPQVPSDHPAIGAMVMNIGANALGLDNAATPMGIKAMKELQSLNPDKTTASNPQILFLVINTSAVTVFPITIMTYRAQLGANHPTDIFLPLLLATSCSTLVGLLVVAAFQRINLFNAVIFSYLGGAILLLGAIAYYFSGLTQIEMQQQSALISNLTLFSLVVSFLIASLRQRINAYEAFIEGAKEGFQTAVMIIPYLVAMLVAIAVFRASGAMDIAMNLIRDGFAALTMDTRFVDALPTAFMKPFSGSGARAMMIDTMQHYGADSFAGRLASIVQGSTETTFYVLTVYFGSVGINNIRHALSCGLAADLAGIVAAIWLGYWFFG